MRLLMTFQEEFPAADPQWVLQAPGRDMWIAANFGSDPTFTFHVPDLEAHTSFNYRSAKIRSTVLNRPLPTWARYVAGVLIVLRNMGMESVGLQAVLAGSEPAGPRYDYALGIAVAGLWHEAHQQPYTAASLIELVEQVRRTYVES
jgi:galactokinase